jgi:hypothetical protein
MHPKPFPLASPHPYLISNTTFEETTRFGGHLPTPGKGVFIYVGLGYGPIKEAASSAFIATLKLNFVSDRLSGMLSSLPMPALVDLGIAYGETQSSL